MPEPENKDTKPTGEEMVIVPKRVLDDLPATRGYVNDTLIRDINTAEKRLGEQVSRHDSKVDDAIGQIRRDVEKTNAAVADMKEHPLEMLAGTPFQKDMETAVSKFISKYAEKAIEDAAKKTINESYAGELLTKLGLNARRVLYGIGVGVLAIGICTWSIHRSVGEIKDTDIGALRSDFASYKREISTQTIKYEKDSAESRKKELGVLETRLRSEVDLKITGIDAKIAAANTDIAKIRTNANALDETYKTLKTELDSIRTYVDTVGKNVEGRLSKEEFDKKLIDVTNGLESLKKESGGNAELRQKYEELRKMVDNLSARQDIPISGQANQISAEDLPELPEIGLRLGY